jgi:hypothetical protein
MTMSKQLFYKAKYLEEHDAKLSKDFDDLSTLVKKLLFYGGKFKMLRDNDQDRLLELLGYPPITHNKK